MTCIDEIYTCVTGVTVPTPDEGDTNLTRSIINVVAWGIAGYFSVGARPMMAAAYGLGAAVTGEVDNDFMDIITTANIADTFYQPDPEGPMSMEQFVANMLTGENQSTIRGYSDWFDWLGVVPRLSVDNLWFSDTARMEMDNFLDSPFGVFFEGAFDTGGDSHYDLGNLNEWSEDNPILSPALSLELLSSKWGDYAQPIIDGIVNTWDNEQTDEAVDSYLEQLRSFEINMSDDALDRLSQSPIFEEAFNTFLKNPYLTREFNESILRDGEFARNILNSNIDLQTIIGESPQMVTILSEIMDSDDAIQQIMADTLGSNIFTYIGGEEGSGYFDQAVADAVNRALGMTETELAQTDGFGLTQVDGGPAYTLQKGKPENPLVILRSEIDGNIEEVKTTIADDRKADIDEAKAEVIVIVESMLSALKTEMTSAVESFVNSKIADNKCSCEHERSSRTGYMNSEAKYGRI